MICVLCSQECKHRVKNNKDGTCELVFHCGRCRRLLMRKKQLEEKLLDVEWELWGLEHTTYFESNKTTFTFNTIYSLSLLTVVFIIYFHSCEFVLHLDVLMLCIC